MLRHLRAGFTYANLAATLALVIALGAGIAYAADGDQDKCDNVKTQDIAAPIEGGKIHAVPAVTDFGPAAETTQIEVNGQGRMVIRVANIDAPAARFLQYTLTARSQDETVGRKVEPRPEEGGTSAEFAFPVKRGNYEISIDVEANSGSGSVTVLHSEDWTYQLLPAA
jgi:hypothetical protein